MRKIQGAARRMVYLAGGSRADEPGSHLSGLTSTIAQLPERIKGLKTPSPVTVP